MLRTLVLGFAASAALGVGLLAATAPASAQSWSVTIGSGHRPYAPAYDGYRPVGQGWSQGWGHGGGWGRGDGWGRNDGWGRPSHPGWGRGHGFHGGPRCTVRHVRYWDGWGWVKERRRVCH